MIAENLEVLVEDTRPSVLARHPEWIVDAVLGGGIDPSGSVVVTGFWRSGTTWLLEGLSKSLGAKSIFEPLMPDTTGYEPHSGAVYQGEDAAIEGFMPYCSESLSDYPVLHRHLVRSLTGAAPGVFVRAARYSVRRGKSPRLSWKIGEIASRLQDAYRSRVVTKFTRAHLLLPLLQTEFGPVVLHLRRDPRAVVESLSRQAWADWANTMSLEDYLLRTGDRRREVFSEWTHEIRRCDRTGAVARVAAYWALVEWYVDQFCTGDEIILSFEEMCREGSDYLREAVRDTFRVGVADKDLSEESGTSGNEKSADERIYGWKQRLGREEIDEIEETVAMFGMESTCCSHSCGSTCSSSNRRRTTLLPVEYGV